MKAYSMPTTQTFRVFGQALISRLFDHFTLRRNIWTTHNPQLPSPMEAASPPHILSLRKPYGMRKQKPNYFPASRQNWQQPSAQPAVTIPTDRWLLRAAPGNSKKGQVWLQHTWRLYADKRPD